jgi:hypothetical protein
MVVLVRAAHRKAALDEFFRVLQPAEIDARERVSARQVEHHQELLRHLEQEVTRLEYAARRAERQYNAVDPENRLIAATLKKRWEGALADYEQTKGRLAEAGLRLPSRPRSRPNCGRRSPTSGSRLGRPWRLR